MDCWSGATWAIPRALQKSVIGISTAILTSEFEMWQTASTRKVVKNMTSKKARVDHCQFCAFRACVFDYEIATYEAAQQVSPGAPKQAEILQLERDLAVLVEEEYLDVQTSQSNIAYK